MPTVASSQPWRPCFGIGAPLRARRSSERQEARMLPVQFTRRSNGHRFPRPPYAGDVRFLAAGQRSFMARGDSLVKHSDNFGRSMSARVSRFRFDCATQPIALRVGLPSHSAGGSVGMTSRDRSGEPAPSSQRSNAVRSGHVRTPTARCCVTPLTTSRKSSAQPLNCLCGGPATAGVGSLKLTFQLLKCGHERPRR